MSSFQKSPTTYGFTVLFSFPTKTARWQTANDKNYCTALEQNWPEMRATTVQHKAGEGFVTESNDNRISQPTF